MQKIKKDGSLTERTTSKASLNYSGEKEKSRAMQSMEHKLMKVIKEVNESDLSETNTPINSPGIFQQQQNKDDKLEPQVLEQETEENSKFQFKDDPKSDVEQKQMCDQHEENSKQDEEVIDNVTKDVKNQTDVNDEVDNDDDGEDHMAVNFEELKAKIKLMPKFRPFHYATNLGGSMDSQDAKNVMKDPDDQTGNSGWGKQMSLHDELISHERFSANEEMRKKIQKQQSLPDNNAPRRRSLKESLMEVVKKPKQFESLKQSFVLLRSNTAPVVEEKEENLTPKEKEAPVQIDVQDDSASMEEDSPKNLRDQISGQAIKSGIVRIWQSWRSSDKTEGPSFTLKRGVSIQPIEVRSRESFIEGGAAGRRTLFQRRRGGSSPLSPQQLEALAKEDSMSPTSFRRCCMDYGSGELVIVDQTGAIRERKLSRGGEASDSSSKDGSIQSDTSLDSEDSCVSVIFVPHPDGKFGMTGEPVPELISGKFNSQRKQSNSSESSESTQSGKTSPIMSPGIRIPQGGSPTKTSIGTKNLIQGKFEVIRQSASGQFEYVSRNVNEDGSCSETVYCISERPLEKIEERHTEESESEAEVHVNKPIERHEDVKKVETIKEQKSQEEAQELVQEAENSVQPKIIPMETLSPKKVAAKHKSFEMEDIPDENPIKCHPEGLSSHRSKRLKSHKARQRASQQMIPNPPKYDYPIVR